jgi:SAM-dependent methyltransferase
VLCLGEGEGRNAVFLAARGHSVTAVDQSAVGLAKASALAQGRGVALTTVVADVSTYPIGPQAWPAIVSIWFHLPSRLRRPVHRAIVAGLAPRGVLVLEAYTPDQLERATGGPPEADRLMTLAGLREELAGLEFEIGREVEREVHEGRLHDGRSAVVQVLARKPA